MLKKLKNKNLKPIDIDGHLQYRCPNCAIDHWLSFKEARTKGFICVCDCGLTFTVKRLIDCKLIFKHKKKKSSQSSKVKQDKSQINSCVSQPAVAKPVEIPVELLEKSTRILVGLGFTKSEAIVMLTEMYSVFPTNDSSLLVKKAVAKIGELNG
jgi:hypothetical protein